jgi:hypothetical protein
MCQTSKSFRSVLRDGGWGDDGFVALEEIEHRIGASLIGDGDGPDRIG